MRVKFPIYYETPTGMSGGATPPAQPATPQPGAPGQGQQGQGNGFRQTFFPNVPDEHWTLMEPHLNNVNRHVTQLQQRYAPFSSWDDAAVHGLASFAQAFDQDPQGQWVNLARTLQQNGHLSDLDVDYLEAILNGEVTDDDDLPQAPSGQGDLSGLPQEVIQHMQEMQARIDQLEGGFTQQQVAQQQRIEDAALDHQMNHIKEQLKTAGFTEDAFDDRFLLGQYIAHRGNAAGVIQTLSNMRTNLVGGYVKQNTTGGSRELDTSNGLPKGAPTRRPGARGRGFLSEASAGAEQALRSALKTTNQ